MRRRAALGLAASLLALPLPAAAQQPAPWAEDGREAMCLVDGLAATPENQEANLAWLQRLQSECQRRFGWTAAQARQAAIVLRATVDLITYRDEANRAGVTEAVLNELAAGFTPEELATLTSNLDDPMSASPRIAGQVAERIRARELSEDAARKAALATMSGLIAVRVVNEFQADLARN